MDGTIARMGSLFIGLMSGTSLDGVDGVLVDLDATDERAMSVRAHAHRSFDAGLADELLALNVAGENELHRAALAANALVRVYAAVIGDLLSDAALPASAVRAIGAHGQTVRHRPREFDGVGYTLQINNAALLAELCGIDVVADFRSRDVAAGGHGAPLVPAFHRAVFGVDGEASAVLNLGGIANLTALRADGTTVGFDCGPANALMDGWCLRHRGEPFDRGGAWAATGRVDDRLLRAMQAEPFFHEPPPKSTGRDLFNAAWLERMLGDPAAHPSPADVQATLAELSAWCAAEAVKSHAPGARRLLVCGGGAFNTHLMGRLAARLHPAPVLATDAAGLPAHQVEAAAFAWLAKAFVEGQPGNLVAVTGAAGPRVLGALYPAGCR
jgi:anhydro-N-acetylmuramic acid kinase